MRRYSAACMFLSSASLIAGMVLKGIFAYSVLIGFGLGFAFTIAATIAYFSGH